MEALYQLSYDPKCLIQKNHGAFRDEGEKVG